jgi:hypothetical protein
MGKKADTTMVYRGKRAKGHASLEQKALTFRSPELRLEVKLEGAQVRAVDGNLEITFGGDKAALELGPTAAGRWAEAIEHPPPRLDKLGVKAGMKLALVGQIDKDFRTELTGRAPPGRLGTGMDAIFFAADKPADLERLEALRGKLAPAGAIWVVRKKGGGPVTEKAVLASAKAAGLVDVKVVAFSETHTAEKLVIPVKKR